MPNAKMAATKGQVWHATRKAKPDPNGNRAERRAAGKRAKATGKESRPLGDQGHGISSQDH